MDDMQTSPTGVASGSWRDAPGKVVGVIKMTVKPGCADALVELKREQFARQFEGEPATELYVFARSLDDPNVF